MIVSEEIEVRNVIATSDKVQLAGPNRDQGKLFAVAIKGDLTYWTVTNTDTGEQALVLNAPEHVMRKVAYDMVKAFEAEDLAQANTREKE